MDPDMSAGQVLYVTWSSNISGLLGTLDSTTRLRFTTGTLPLGTHIITVNVTDGQYHREAWFDLTVEPKYIPPEPEPVVSSPFPQILAVAGVALAVFFVILIAVMLVLRSRRGRSNEELLGAPSPPPPLHSTSKGDLPAMEGDLSRLAKNLGDMASQLEAQREAEAVVTRQTQTSVPQPTDQPVAPVLTKAEKADREHTREVREVMKALTQLPQGLPTSLWGWEMAELARAVVDGERQKAPDGTPIVGIKDKWYNADRTNVGVFMREWKEPEAAQSRSGSMTKDERSKRLEQLETALLEGKISEQTYRELKRKYEGGN